VGGREGEREREREKCAYIVMLYVRIWLEIGGRDEEEV
jgi:hypothetical protein